MIGTSNPRQRHRNPQRFTPDLYRAKHRPYQELGIAGGVESNPLGRAFFMPELAIRLSRGSGRIEPSRAIQKIRESPREFRGLGARRHTLDMTILMG